MIGMIINLTEIPKHILSETLTHFLFSSLISNPGSTVLWVTQTEKLPDHLQQI